MLMGWSRQLDQVANTVIEAWQLHTSRRWNVEFPRLSQLAFAGKRQRH